MSFSYRFLTTLVLLVALFSVSLAHGQGSDDFDFTIEAPTGEITRGSTFTIETILTARCCETNGAQGWAYGVAHDPNSIEILDVTLAGTDAEQLLAGDDGFNQFHISTSESGDKLGFTQGYAASATMPVFIPISNRFSMASASYRATGSSCGAQDTSITTSISYTDDLLNQSELKEEIILVVFGESVRPDVIQGADVTISCDAISSRPSLTMAGDVNLTADRSSTVSIDILAENTGSNELQVEGWSYAIQIDGSLLDVSSFSLGDDAASLKGSSGPDFEAHDTIDEDTNGTLDGVIAGAVVDVEEAPNNDLILPVGSPQKIGKLELRSAITIPKGGASRTTDLNFTNIQGDDQLSTIEVLFTIDNGSEPVSLIPDFSQSLTVTLLAGVGGRGDFVRGDANNDTRIDISDGIWIIMDLFFQTVERKPCFAPSDANDDGLVDLADAMYIFNWRLPRIAVSPPPPAPFPNCGPDPDNSDLPCPVGSTVCP